MSFFKFYRGGLEADKEKKVFRKWFPQFGEIRSYFSRCICLGIKCYIYKCNKEKGHRSSWIERLQVHYRFTKSKKKINTLWKVKQYLESSLVWIVDLIRYMKENFPHTIICCNSVRDAGKIYNFLVNELNDVNNIFKKL